MAAQGIQGIGAPRILCEKVIKKFEEFIPQLHVIDNVCKRIGIADATFYAWLQAAESEKALPIYREFAERVNKARTVAQGDLLDQIAQRPVRWEALAWTLERCYPTIYARREKTEVSHTGTVSVEHVVSILENVRHNGAKAGEIVECEEVKELPPAPQ